MDVGDVMDEIAAAVATIGGVRVHAFPVLKVVGESAVVGYPDGGTFRTTYGRGVARMTIPLMIMIPRPTERSTRDRASKYLDGAGAASIPALVDGYAWTKCHHVTAGDWDIEVVQMAAVDHLMITISLDVVGSGK